MRRERPDLLFLGVMLAIILLAAGLTWFNYQFTPQAGKGDAFAPIWVGVRSAILSGSSPYAPQVLSQAAALVEDPGIPPRFVYPYYSLPLFAPFVLAYPYPLARAIWMTAMFASLVGVIFASLALVGWRPPGGTLVALVVFSLGSYPAVRSVYLGNPAPLAALLVALGLLLVLRKHDALAGVFFSLAAIKPQMVILLWPFVLLWAVSRRRMALVWSLLLSALALLVGAFLVSPDWFPQNYVQLLSFFEESFPASIPMALWYWMPQNGLNLMAGIAILFAIWLLVEWWRTLGKGDSWFLWTAAFSLTVTQVIGIPTSTSNMVVLFIPLILAFSVWTQRWRVGGGRISLAVMALLALGMWALSRTGGGQVQPVSMFFPMPLVTLLALYWVRYWALDSIRLRVDHIEALRRL